MKRSEYYLTAFSNLGFLPFLRFEFQKRAAHSAPFKLSSKKLKFPVRARPRSSDLGVFYQIFVFDEYRCLSGLASPGLILDLGANVGYSTAYFLSQFKGCSVIAVEPDPSNFEALRSNVSPYGGRVTIMQAAVWPRTEQISLEHPGAGEEWGVRVKPSSEGTVTTVTIPDLLRISGQKRISLLKIDIEGAEIDLFKSDTEWLESVDNIVIELHGEEAEAAFFDKIDRSKFAISKCDELTVCMRLFENEEK